MRLFLTVNHDHRYLFATMKIHAFGVCVQIDIYVTYILSFYKDKPTHDGQNQITSSCTLHISLKSKVHVLKHFPWCIVAAPPLPFVRINMTVKRACPKGFNWCWHTWSTHIKLWLRAEMATNSGSNTIVEQTSATNNRCLRTAPILRRILGGSLPCDILRCFQQIAFRKTNANDQLV